MCTFILFVHPSVRVPCVYNTILRMILTLYIMQYEIQAAVDRTRMFYRKEVRPYLSGVLDAFKNDPGPPPSDQDAPPPSAAR